MRISNDRVYFGDLACSDEDKIILRTKGYIVLDYVELA